MMMAFVELLPSPPDTGGPLLKLSTLVVVLSNLETGMLEIEDSERLISALLAVMPVGNAVTVTVVGCTTLNGEVVALLADVTAPFVH